ncbi:MAG TPA: hypothetical protein VF432_09990 [Thermoanaerobaculia bacterium]
MAEKNATLEELETEVEALNKKVKSLGTRRAGGDAQARTTVSYDELLGLVRRMNDMMCW